MRGDTADRLVTNAEELVLQAMSTEVTLVMTKMASDGKAAPAKVVRSLENCLRWLDDAVDSVRAALPVDRALSFVEVSLFCLVTHLPFRQVMDVAPYARLAAFAEAFGERASARATEYRFDKA
jgi:hypothetical protein